MSTAGEPRWSRWIHPSAPGARVTRLEQFYDLVFVFAFLNVTTLVGERLSAVVLFHGLLVLGLLWWCWTSFAALGNAIRADQGIIPLVGFATMAAVLLLTLSSGEAFVDRPGGLPGPFGAMLPRARWTLVSAGHWAERHALIVLVALGESIIALGIGANPSALSVTWPLAIAAVLGIAVISSLWWAYFDAPALAVEQVLHRTRVAELRISLARDVYTYLHLPMIVGIILFALGLKRYLADIGSSLAAGWQYRISGIELYLLFGGVLLYLLAVLAMVRYADRRVRPRRVVYLVLAAVPAIVAIRPPALVALGGLAAACVSLALLQLSRRDLSREEVRRVALGEQKAAAAEQSEWRRRHL